MSDGVNMLTHGADEGRPISCKKDDISWSQLSDNYKAFKSDRKTVSRMIGHN